MIYGRSWFWDVLMNKNPGRKLGSPTKTGWYYCGFCEFRFKDYDYMNDVHIPKHRKEWPK